MRTWFPEPEKRDDTYARVGEGTLSWLARSTVARAVGYRAFLNGNLATLPRGCREGIRDHLLEERHHRDGLFELVVGRALQELGGEVGCEPEGLPSGRRPDFVARFPDGTAFVEAVSPVLDRELGKSLGGKTIVTKLVEEAVPSGWAANIRALPRVAPDGSRRHIKAFLKRSMDIPPPAGKYQTVGVRGSFEQGDLDIVLIPQARHGLSPDTKIAAYGATAYFPDDERALRNAVRRKYRQLRGLEGATTLVALNMTSTSAGREELDRALFGVTVSQVDGRGNEVGRYFRGDGLFVGGTGEPTISAVLAFPEVGVLRCADPVLWAHPRFGSPFPAGLDDLEVRSAPDTGAEVRVRRAKSTGVLGGLGFVAED